MNIIKRYMHTRGNDMEERSKGKKKGDYHNFWMLVSPIFS